MTINLNVGIAKSVVSNKVASEYINESQFKKSKGMVSDFVKTIKKSPILIKEFYFIQSVEGKHIESDLLASKFIDNNLKAFSNTTKREVTEAHSSLNKFINKSDVKNISESKVKLYDSIGILIENYNQCNDINVLNDAYLNVVEYLKNNVSESVEEIDNSEIIAEGLDMDVVVKIATEKFNQKYSSLNENDKSVVKTLVFGSTEDKKNLFETLKKENLESLKSTDSNGFEDKINEAIAKLNKMQYDENTLVENVLNLNVLKNNLN